VTHRANSDFQQYANKSASSCDDVILSILIPFFGDDPTRLTAELNVLVGARRNVEILLLDDGLPDEKLNASVARTVNALSTPTRLLTSKINLGRSCGRNLLSSQAKGRWLLFLDADMSPGSEAFLDAYLELIEQDDFDAAFGGYETDNAQDPRFQVHAALSQTSDQNDATDRQKIGATAFCSSNLLVRARVMRDVRFDESFTGWGWEDVDWAVRASRAHTLIHTDNPAGHSGLQVTDTLLEKFRVGASNYARLLEKHPQLASLPGARVAKTLKSIPFQKLLRGLWAQAAKSDGLPMKMRTTALKLWRASWTAEAI